MAQPSADGDLTDEQRAVYDRQLRVWGVEAQRRLGQSKFFVAGLSGLCAEACKNVVLAGIGHMTLFEDGVLAKNAHPGNFLAHAGLADHSGDRDTLTAAEATAATLREMNPFAVVEVVSGTGGGDGAGNNTFNTYNDFVGVTEGMLRTMDVVLLCGASLRARERIGDLARSANASIFAGAVRGYAADFIADLGPNFEHVVETVKSCTDGTFEKVKEQKSTTFVPLKTALMCSWKDLAVCREGGMRRVNRLAAAAIAVAHFERRNGRVPNKNGDSDINSLIDLIPGLEREAGVKPGWFKPETLSEYVGTTEEAPAVAAIIGGVLAQEMLRAVTHVGEPVRNGFFFGMEGGQGTCENLGCP